MLPLLSILGLLVVMALAVMGCEYMCVILYPEWILTGMIPVYLVMLLKHLVLPARLGGSLLYCLMLLFIRMEATQKKEKPSTPSWRITLVSLLGFGLSLLGLYLLSSFPPNQWLIILYPGLVIINFISAPFFVKALAFKPNNWGIKNPQKKQKSRLGFFLRLQNGWINIANPFRGILVIGAAGSGKSYSVAEPLIEQAAQKGYAGILYDFKFPTLTKVAYTAYHHCPEEITFYVLNFVDLSRSHRVNPLKPENMLVISYAEEYAQAIISNLLPETIQHKDFWVRSAAAVLTATIWYMRKHHPEHCTLPHVVALICNKEYKRLIKLLEQDIETAGLVASLSVALENSADNQIAGVMASIQIALSRINNPDIAWVMSGDDFSLDLNNPADKKFLCIGSSAVLVDTLAPVISCVITVALKLMNQEKKHHSLILLDEAPTLYIPKFEQIPATARSNQIAAIYMAQDISQMVQSYGAVNSEVILGNLNTQLFGRISNQRTAEYISSIFGKEEKDITYHSQSLNGNSGLLHEYGLNQRIGKSVTFQTRETPIFKPQEAMNLEVGEFVGMTVGNPNQRFQGKIKRKKQKESLEIPAFASGIDVARNFERICGEVKGILGEYLFFL